MTAIPKNHALAHPIYAKSLAILVVGAAWVPIIAPARAFTVNAVFDSSVTSAANATTIEAAFNTAAAVYTRAFGNPVTVNIQIGWGEVGGTPLPSNFAAASQVSLAGFWTYAQIRGYLAPHVSLPATQTGPRYVAMARAEAKALGLAAAQSTLNDGSVGFNSSLNYSFTQGGSGYDFVGLAEHEIAEVLGRNSSINPAGGNSFYQNAVDLFRYSAPGKQDYSATDATYFSLDGGVTNLGWWDYAADGGDRSDWLTGSYSGSYPGDVQNAYLYPGATSIAPADIALLGALGWAGTVNRPLVIFGKAVGTTSGGSALPLASDDIDAVLLPEPPATMFLGVGLTGLAWVRRRRVNA